MDEWERLRARLATAGVAGVEDLGRFVSKPEFFGESRFDERALLRIAGEPRYARARQQALEHFDQVAREHRGSSVGDQAAREAKKARKSLS